MKDIEMIEDKINELLIDSYESEHNAYNWGLNHALLAMRGVDVNTIISQRERMTKTLRTI